MPIFDQGYQHWSGKLSGGGGGSGSHAWRWLAITRHGVRTGMKNRVLRLLLIVSWIPALALVVMLCLWGMLERKSAALAPMMQFLTFLHPEILADPRHYRVQIWTICYDFFLLTELRFSMVVVLLVGPNLISQDLRFNALPLYFSRPLRRIDYFLGKLGVIFVFLARMIVLPCLIAYVLGLLFSLDWTILHDTLRLLVSGVAYGLIIALSAGTLILALSSLSRNSRYVALFWLGIWFVGSVVGGILQTADREQRRQAMYAAIRVPAIDPTASPAEQLRQQRNWERALRKAQEDYEKQEARATARDWRPLASYTANLSRVGEHLLGTNASWASLSRLLPAEERPQFLLTFMGPQYPWQWSAGVLLGLFGLSACILNFRVKSLDRLK
jgi:ABC-2 type transport system permease protein